jgi:hypothetical protein
MVMTTTISWKFIKTRYLAFWSKYNYILASAFGCGIAISGIIQFVVLGFLPDDKAFPIWWGNADEVGCNVRGTCPLLPIPEVGYFGPTPGTFKL